MLNPLRLFLLVVSLAALLVGSMLPPTRGPEPRFRLGTFPRPSFEPLHLARTLGVVDESRVEFVEFPSAPEMMQAFRNGVIDAATVTTDDVLRLADDGHDFRIVLVMDYSLGLDAILARPEVKDVAALKGRTVAVESSSLGAYILASGLAAAKRSPSDVKILSTRADRMDRELAAGAVDAVVCSEPHRTLLLRQGLHSIYDSSVLYTDVMTMVVVQAPLAQNPPAALRDVAAVWLRGVDYLQQNRNDAVRQIAPRQRLTPAEVVDALSRARFSGEKDNFRQLNRKTSTLPDHFRRVSARMLADRMLRREADFPSLISDCLFPAPR